MKNPGGSRRIDAGSSEKNQLEPIVLRQKEN
jgi:hypothetical protein